MNNSTGLQKTLKARALSEVAIVNVKGFFKEQSLNEYGMAHYIKANDKVYPLHEDNVIKITHHPSGNMIYVDGNDLYDLGFKAREMGDMVTLVLDGFTIEVQLQ